MHIPAPNPNLFASESIQQRKPIIARSEIEFSLIVQVSIRSPTEPLEKHKSIANIFFIFSLYIPSNIGRNSRQIGREKSNCSSEEKILCIFTWLSKF
jgi:hypothetical protein